MVLRPAARGYYQYVVNQTQFITHQTLSNAGNTASNSVNKLSSDPRTLKVCQSLMSGSSKRLFTARESQRLPYSLMVSRDPPLSGRPQTSTNWISIRGRLRLINSTVQLYAVLYLALIAPGICFDTFGRNKFHLRRILRWPPILIDDL